MPSRQMNYPPRRRRRGVPMGLVIALIITALAIGGVAGYALYVRASRSNLNGTVTILPGMPSAQQTPAPAAAEDDADLTGEFVDQAEAVELLSGDNAAAPLNDPFEPSGGQTPDEALASIEQPVIVAEYSGKKIMSNEILDAYNELVSTYLMAGFSVEDYADELLEDVLYEEVRARVAREKAEELNLTALTDADNAEITRQAEAVFEELLAGYLAPDADEAARAEAIARMEAEEGLTLESLKELIAAEWWNEKLYAHVTGDVKVTEEALQTAYEELVAQQKSAFGQFPEDYEYARMNGEMIACNPSGYRTVKHIFLTWDANEAARAAELQMELTGLKAEENPERIAEINAELDKLYAPLDEKAQSALDRIAAGETFEALMAEISQDEMMTSGTTAETGYYVSKNTVLWSDEFVAAAMALLKPGEVSNAFHGEDGVHIVFYAADVKPGSVPLSEIRAQLEAETLYLLQEETYTQQMDLWLEEAQAVCYPERLK